MKNRDKYIIGIVGAALAGVAVGLLFYTEGGKKARKKIKATAEDWSDSLGSLIASGKENLADLSDKAKDRYKKMKSTAKDKFNRGKESYADFAED